MASRIFAFVARRLWHMALHVLWRQYSPTTARAERLLDLLALEYRHVVTFLWKLSVPGNEVLDFSYWNLLSSEARASSSMYIQWCCDER